MDTVLLLYSEQAPQFCKQLRTALDTHSDLHSHQLNFDKLLPKEQQTNLYGHITLKGSDGGLNTKSINCRYCLVTEIDQRETYDADKPHIIRLLSEHNTPSLQIRWLIGQLQQLDPQAWVNQNSPPFNPVDIFVVVGYLCQNSN